MGPSLDKLIFLLLFVKINVLEGRALIEGCSCAKSVPFAVTIPVAPPPLDIPCPTHGYKIEVPPAPCVPPKVAYALDVVVEAPLPPVPPTVCNPNLITGILKPALPEPDCEPPAVAPAPCAACAAAAPAPPPLAAALPLPAALPAPALPAPSLAAALPALAPALPALPALNALAALSALAALTSPAAAAPALVDDFSGVAPLAPPAPAPVAYQLITSALPAALPAPLPPAYSLPLSDLPAPCGCAAPAKPACRYVLKGFQSNTIYRGRRKRDASPSPQNHKFNIDELRDFIKSLKTSRVTRKAKKSKIVKRDIKGEYDLLQRELSQMDLTIPEIIQYMPETMLPSFKRGKCNFGCKNCINDSSNKNENTKASNPASHIKETTSEEKKQTTNQQPPNENTTESPNQRFDLGLRSINGESYFKRSVNPIQNLNPNPNSDPSNSELMTPPYIPSNLEMTKLAQNPGDPIWYQPQPLTDPNVEYVYDRLGHKYKVKNGSFKLVTPKQNDDNDEVNPSTATTSVDNQEATTENSEALVSSLGNVRGSDNVNNQQQVVHNLDPETQKMLDSAMKHHEFIDISAPSQDAIIDQTMIQTPPEMVGAPPHHGSSYDPQMDKIIRDIVYRHPDFIDATQHEQGSLTLPQEVAQEETLQFLHKLIRGRFSKWFGQPSEDVPIHSLQDLNRYSRDTGTTIKFIPIVTVDKQRLNTYRQSKSPESP